MFSYISAEQRVPQDHPLRRIRAMTDTALQAMSPLFTQMYWSLGRPSIAPEKLLRALLLQAFYSVRSGRRRVDWQFRLYAAAANLVRLEKLLPA